MKNITHLLATSMILTAATSVEAANNVYTEPSNVTSQNSSASQFSISDHDIAQKIRANIGSSKTLSNQAKSIQVSVKDGIVTLKGSVANEKEKGQISDSIRTIPGVKTISNNLTISS